MLEKNWRVRHTSLVRKPSSYSQYAHLHGVQRGPPHDARDLLPIYEQLISYIKTLGSDVTITPKKGSVSIIRKRQFFLIKPATKSRIDLGFKLKDKPVTDRLENSGPFGTMCTHRVKISSIDEIDNELMDWIKEAYTKSL